MNIIDEASRFHVALVLKEGEPSEFGNLTAMDYIEAVRMNWFQGRQLSSAWTQKVRSDLTSFKSGAPLEALKFKWRLVRHTGKLELLRPTFDFWRINCL